MPVEVSSEILEGIKVIKNTSVVNMFDASSVARLCKISGFRKTAKWIKQNPSLYAHLILEGPEEVQACDN